MSESEPENEITDLGRDQQLLYLPFPALHQAEDLQTRAKLSQVGDFCWPSPSCAISLWSLMFLILVAISSSPLLYPEEEKVLEKKFQQALCLKKQMLFVSLDHNSFWQLNADKWMTSMDPFCPFARTTSPPMYPCEKYTSGNMPHFQVISGCLFFFDDADNFEADFSISVSLNTWRVSSSSFGLNKRVKHIENRIRTVIDNIFAKN